MTRAPASAPGAVRADDRLGPSEIGDLFLDFGGPEPRSPQRGGEIWHPIASTGDWTLRASTAGPGWSGFPFERREGRGWTAFLLGELYPLRPLDRDRIVTRLIESGETSELNGHFALLVWRHQPRTWHVWTSPFGTLHLFHARGAGRPSLGTAFSVARARRDAGDVDARALRSLLTYGFFLGDSTHFDDVRVLRPATHYTLDRTGRRLTEERYLSWSDSEPAPDGDVVERFDGLLRTVVGDLASDQTVALPISGGLDSRSTVAALSRSGAATGVDGLEAFSYGYAESSVETGIATRIAAARDLPLVTFTIPTYLLDRLPTLTSQLEGFQDVTLPRQAAVAGRLRSKRIMAAHWGDVWLDAATEEGVEVDWELADAKFRKPGSDWLTSHFRLAQTAHDARDLLREEWRPYEPIESPELRFKAFKTDQWSFRWTLPSLRTYQSWAYPRLPFYDTRLTRFLTSLEPGTLRGRRLQIEHLRRYAPDLARIEWQPRGTNLFDLERSTVRAIADRTLARGRRLITRDRPIERNWEVQLAGQEARTRLESLLARPEGRLGAWFRPQDTADLIDDFYRRWPDRELGYAISMLVSLASWLDAEPR